MSDKENDVEEDVKEDAEDGENAEELTLEKRVENLEKDILDMMDEREDLLGEVEKLKIDVGRVSQLMGNAKNAVSTKDDKTLRDVAQKFRR